LCWCSFLVSQSWWFGLLVVWVFGGCGGRGGVVCVVGFFFLDEVFFLFCSFFQKVGLLSNFWVVSLFWWGFFFFWEWFFFGVGGVVGLFLVGACVCVFFGGVAFFFFWVVCLFGWFFGVFFCFVWLGFASCIFFLPNQNRTMLS